MTVLVDKSQMSRVTFDHSARSFMLDFPIYELIKTFFTETIMPIELKFYISVIKTP